MKVLVTGSEGFLGRRLGALLEAKTEHTVLRYDLQLGHDVLNAEQLDDALNGVDACIHLAAVADLYIAEENPERTQSINVEATRLVLEACNRHDVRLLFASTVCAYGNNGYEQSDENAPLAPTEVYASSKATAETLCGPTRQALHSSIGHILRSEHATFVGYQCVPTCLAK